jgi:molybdate transport system substrate-binding protein
MRARGSVIARAGVVVLALAAAGCGSGKSGSAPAGSAGKPGGTLTIFAAASLTETFTELGRRFEADHPGATVRFNFGPSSGLAEQIVDGAPADLFASASPTNMATVVDAGEASDPRTFGTNSLQIAVPPDNPAQIDSLEDLARSSVKVALCQPQVPCGRVAAKVFDNAGLAVRPVTEAQDVKAVLTLVEIAEVDAGLVYVTDVRAAGDEVRAVAIPAAVNASTKYPIAVTAGSANAVTARAFVDFVLSPAGQSVLAAAGFARP